MHNQALTNACIDFKFKFLIPQVYATPYNAGQFAQAYQDPTHAILSVWIDVMLLNREKG